MSKFQKFCGFSHELSLESTETNIKLSRHLVRSDLKCSKDEHLDQRSLTRKILEFRNWSPTSKLCVNKFVKVVSAHNKEK